MAVKNTEAEGNLMRTFENEVLHGDKMTGPLTEVRHAVGGVLFQ